MVMPIFYASVSNPYHFMTPVAQPNGDKNYEHSTCLASKKLEGVQVVSYLRKYYPRSWYFHMRSDQTSC